MTTKDPWILLALLGLIAGCGQKGPLVLPDQQHPHKKLKIPAASAPAASAPVPSATPEAPTPPATSPGADAADPPPSDRTAPP